MKYHFSSICLFFPLITASRYNVHWLQWLNLMLLPFVSFCSHFTFVNKYSSHIIFDRLDTSVITCLAVTSIFKRPLISIFFVLLKNLCYTKIQRDFWFIMGMLNTIYNNNTLYNILIILSLPFTNRLLRIHNSHVTQFIWHMNAVFFLNEIISLT
jgi:hypothetical protein